MMPVIRVVRTRKVRAMTEKFYGRVARTVVIHGLPDEQGPLFMLRQALEEAVIEDDLALPASTLRHVRMTQEQADKMAGADADYHRRDLFGVGQDRCHARKIAWPDGEHQGRKGVPALMRGQPEPELAIADGHGLTHVGRALEELGIGSIPAGSPQAKGRIERCWGTAQGRLPILLRRAGAHDRASANVVLADWLPRFNAACWARSDVKRTGSRRRRVLDNGRGVLVAAMLTAIATGCTIEPALANGCQRALQQRDGLGHRLPVALAAMVPVLNLFVVPAAVCGATAYWVRENGSNTQ